jgi:rubredoxin
MPQPRQCPKCHGSLAEGFVVDASHGTMGVSSWVEGAPEKSIWTGVKLRGRGRSEIASWRCGNCGFLEHYAPAAPHRKHESAQSKQALIAVAISLAVLVLVLGAVLAFR